MTARFGQAARRLVLILFAAGPGVGVSLWLARSNPALSPYLTAIVVFLTVKAGGDVARYAMYPQPMVIYEDFLRDLIIFAGLGVLAAGAAHLATTFIGGGVHPIVPAIGGYVAYTLQETRPQ